ncbi:hypothetical protein [Aeromicrobium sp. UC242_57]|uniref:hypothetical protein n=1 Tax=Aeromicrobium sp. UC242_57 TaxID=3374624 RepID=UPI0037998D59
MGATLAAQGSRRVVIATVLPRDLHPGAWWIWALGLAAAVSLMTNPILIVLVVLVVCFVVISRRTAAPWAMSFRFYLYLALLIITIRVVFRILVGGAGSGQVLFTLPEIPLPDVARGITLLGPVHAHSLLGGLYDGMRLAAIVICVGAANTLANPKRLLKSMPPALYEVGTAIVVALSVFRGSPRACSGFVARAGCAATRARGSARCAASSCQCSKMRWSGR